jgi:transcriptional regulator with XRE-family HTH domain
VRINPEALRTIRKDRDVTLTALAKAVGVQHSHLSNIEAGRREASSTLIRKLAIELKIDVLALLGPENRDEAKAEAAS